MWIDGRRAFRPDSNYYRDVRRKSLRSSRGRRNSFMAAVIVMVAVTVILIWLMVR